MVVDQPRVSVEGPERRVIFLGASNLAFGFRTIVEEARSIYRDPLDIVFALGHGRSYGCTSRVLGRQLPAILACRIWKEIAQRPTLPTTAFITDVGNDILYLRSPDSIMEWLETIVQRLQQLDATIHISSLPLTSIRKLRPLKLTAASESWQNDIAPRSSATTRVVTGSIRFISVAPRSALPGVRRCWQVHHMPRQRMKQRPRKVYLAHGHGIGRCGVSRSGHDNRLFTWRRVHASPSTRASVQSSLTPGTVELTWFDSGACATFSNQALPKACSSSRNHPR